MSPSRLARTEACLRLCRHCRTYFRRSPHRSKRETNFPHGFSATEPLVPPSADGSTPITDALARSILLDPTSYKSKQNFRQPPPNKDPTTPVSELEKRIIENPFAKILASKIRSDKVSFNSLPTDLLLKFSIFQYPESEALWLLPSDIPSISSKAQGTYRQNRKLAIDELGERTRYKKWQTMVPYNTPEKIAKNLVWRDGMSEHILRLLQGEAKKRLFSLRRQYMFHANVDASLTTATVGQNIGPKDQKNPVNNMTDMDVSEDEMMPKGTRDTHVNQQDARDTKLLRNTDTDTFRELSSLSIQQKRDEQPPSELLHISAILYLGPPELRNSWEFKSIAVENQSTQAILFNLRRLFPSGAERILSNRTELGNAIAVQSSEMSAAILRHMLRLAFYIEGDETASLTLEELEGYNQKKMEKSSRDNGQRRDVVVSDQSKQLDGR